MVARQPRDAVHAGGIERELGAALVVLRVEDLVDRTLGAGLLAEQPSGVGSQDRGVLRLLLRVQLGDPLTPDTIGLVGDAVEEGLPRILLLPTEDRRRVERHAGDGVALVR